MRGKLSGDALGGRPGGDTSCTSWRILANGRAVCRALKDLYCAIEEKPCSFYKAREQDGRT